MAAKIKADNETPEAPQAREVKKTPEELLTERYPGYTDLKVAPDLAGAQALVAKGYEIAGKHRIGDGRSSEWHLGKRVKA